MSSTILRQSRNDLGQSWRLGKVPKVQCEQVRDVSLLLLLLLSLKSRKKLVFPAFVCDFRVVTFALCKLTSHSSPSSPIIQPYCSHVRLHHSNSMANRAVRAADGPQDEQRMANRADRAADGQQGEQQDLFSVTTQTFKPSKECYESDGNVGRREDHLLCQQEPPAPPPPPPPPGRRPPPPPWPPVKPRQRLRFNPYSPTYFGTGREE